MPATRIFVPPFGVRTQRFAIVVVALALASLWLHSLWVTGTWDWLLISGWLALILGLSFAQSTPDRLNDALARLADRGVLAVTANQLYRFLQHLEERIVKLWAPWVGSVGAFAIAGAFLIAYDSEVLAAKFPLILAEMLGGYIAGCYIGRMACYGTLGTKLTAQGLPLRVMAGHLDAVGGLKPVGEFYFYQAMVVAVPAIFLAVWLLLIPLPYFQQQYAQWQAPYAGLLALAIFFVVLAFLMPLWSFHRVMLRQKRDLLREADRLSPKIAEIQRELGEGQPAERADSLKETLADMTTRWQAIERLPVWPVDLRMKWRFGLNNFILFVPVISQVTGLSKVWSDFLTALFKTASG